MFTLMLGLVIGLMVQNLGAMEKKEKPKKPRSYSLHLSAPDQLSIPKKGFTTSDSPKGSPNTSTNSSPTQSPRHSPKERTIFTSKKSPKRVSLQDHIEERLKEAIKENNTEDFLALIEPNVNILCEGKPLLSIAIKNGNTEVVRRLLDLKNIDLNMVDKKNGSTPFHQAVMFPTKDILLLLLHDYRVNSSIKNHASKLAKKATDDDFYIIHSQLKAMIIARTSLDELVASIMENQKDTDAIAVTVKQSMVKVIPDQDLIKYATDEFIKNMIVYRAGKSGAEKS